MDDLTEEELSDMMLTARKIGRAMQAKHGGNGQNIAIQDGLAAGQTVPHVGRATREIGSHVDP